MSEYIGNAKVLKLSELPKVGEKRNYLLAEYVCIEVKLKEIQDDYFIYDTKYCEVDSMKIIEDDFHINCCHWSYAVNREELS